MQGKEKINFDDYEILNNQEDSPTGKTSIPNFEDMYDFYEVIVKFSLEEIVKKQRDFEVLGQYLDYNLYLSSPCHFLGFLRFAYQPFYRQNASTENTEMVQFYNLSIQYKIAQYVNEWVQSKVVELGLQDNFEYQYVTSLPIFSSMYHGVMQSYDRVKRDNLVDRLTAFINGKPIPPKIYDNETKPQAEEIKAVKTEKPNRKKQPTAKVIMEFINLIDDRVKIIPKDGFNNNDEKYFMIATKIKKMFEYEYAGGTLEKEYDKQEGYSLDAYNLLIEWQYNTEAIKYKNKHGR